jgi:DNA-binding winged helix-turn-helix (wHTH) protein/TolB-like protein
MAKPTVYEFGPFRLDLARQLLLREGEAVTLQRRTFETLALLVENSGRLVEKEEFMQAVWRDSFVEDGSLTVNISILRRTLGDDANGRRYIETVPRRGYRFVAPVREARGEGEVQESRAAESATPLTGPHGVPSAEADAIGSAPGPVTLRPGGVTRRRAFLFAAAPAALAGALGYRFWPARARTIAVLPLSNLRPDPETNFLGYSLADAVAGKLGSLRTPQIIPLSTVYRPTNQTPDPQQAAAQLSADLLVHGSYLMEDDRLRVTAVLTEMPARHALWQETLDLRYDKLMTVHEQVARRVVTALNVRLTDAESRRLAADAARDPLAYEYYLRGVDHYAESRLDLAIAMLEESVALDPRFARAWDYLGSSYAVSASIRFGGREHYARAERAFERAVKLNPAEPRPGIFYADLLIETNRVEQAVGVLAEVLAADAGNALAMWEMSYACRYAGLLPESLRWGGRALAADPSFKLSNAVFITHLYTGEYQKFLDGLATVNDTAYAGFYRGFAHYHLKDYGRARAEFDRAHQADPEMLQTQVGKALSLGLAQETRRGLELLARAEREVAAQGVGDAEGVYKIAQGYAALGERAGALRVMRRSVEGGFFCHPYFTTDPLTAGLRGESGFAELIEAARRRHEAFKQAYPAQLG